MKSRIQSIFNFLKTPKPIPAGIYAYQSPSDEPAPQKIYLRVEPNGYASLIINASTILHLNPVAAEFAHAYLHRLDEEQTIQNVLLKYRVDKDTVRRDYHSFLETLESFTKTEDLDPIEFFGFDRATHENLEGISAPFRLDCAITYRLPDSASAAYAPHDRVKNELSTADWKIILDKAWQAGIPHIIFTGGEPTLRPDLLDLILHVEQNGQICGLITDGQIFQNAQVLQDYLNAGLDHLMLLLDPRNKLGWKIIELITPYDIFIAVHITINGENAPQISDTIARLAALGTKALSLSMSTPELSNILTEATDLASYYELKLIWDLPVPYSKFNPIRLETIREELFEGAGKTWLYVEPDGDVLPSQGIANGLGNLLTQDWKEIWKNCQDNVK